MSRVLIGLLASSLLLLGAASCTQKRDAQAPAKSIPLAGQSQLPQVFFLLDATASSLRHSQWGEFEPSSLSTEIPARIEFKFVHSLEEAKEALQVINGRQVDELFLGLGLPQKAWTELSMPRVEKRRVFAFAPEVKNSSWIVLTPDYNELSMFLLRLCSMDFVEASCVLDPEEFLKTPQQQKQKSARPTLRPFVVHMGASEIQNTDGSLPVSVNIWIDWSEFFRTFVLGQHQVSALPSDNFNFGFSSSVLKVSKAAAIQKDVSKSKKFDEFLKLFNLEVLGGTARGAGYQIPSADVLKHPEAPQRSDANPADAKPGDKK